jgi:hypothetical protein
VRGLDQLRTGIGDRRAAGLREQTDVVAREAVVTDFFDNKLPHRHAERAKEGPRAFRVFDHEMPQAADFFD